MSRFEAYCLVLLELCSWLLPFVMLLAAGTAFICGQLWAGILGAVGGFVVLALRILVRPGEHY